MCAVNVDGLWQKILVAALIGGMIWRARNPDFRKQILDTSALQGPDPFAIKFFRGFPEGLLLFLLTAAVEIAGRSLCAAP